MRFVEESFKKTTNLLGLLQNSILHITDKCIHKSIEKSLKHEMTFQEKIHFALQFVRLLT